MNGEKTAQNTFSIRIIDARHAADINLPNEPFPLFGRMIPTYVDERWAYSIEKYSEPSQMCFPDENYDFDEMSGNSFFIGAYDGENCIGLAIMQHAFFKYMYLYDMKVNREYRKKGVAGALIEKAKELALQNGYRGIYTQGQDNNLGACLFYLKTGFVIGGLDTKVYQGTPQENKKDILFYLDILPAAPDSSASD